MNFSNRSRTLWSGRTCNQKLYSKRSATAENATSASKQFDSQGVSANTDQISTELNEEKTRAVLEPLDGQLLTLTKFHKQVLQDTSAITTPYSGSRTHRPQFLLTLD